MKQTVQHKIDKLVKLSKSSKSNAVVRKPFNRKEQDGLSVSIRSKQDAEIFKRELQVALKSRK